MTETLHRGSDVGGLVDVGLPKRRGPIDLIGHHADNRGIVRDGFHTDIPILVVYAILAVGANVACCLFDLIGECGGDKHLCQKRVGIEGDRRKKIVELVGREIFVRSPLILRWNLILRLRRGLILPQWARRSGSSLEGRDAGETKREYDGQRSRHESDVSLEASLPKDPKGAVSRTIQQLRPTGSGPRRGLG